MQSQNSSVQKSRSRIRVASWAAALAMVTLPAAADPAVFFDYNLDTGRQKFLDVLDSAVAPSGGSVEIFEYNFFDNQASNPQDPVTITGSDGTEIVVDFYNYGYNGATQTLTGAPAFDYDMSGPAGVNSYSVSYNSGDGLDAWREIVLEGFGVSVYEADGTTPITMNALGLEVNDWGTCCTDESNILPDGETYADKGDVGATAVYAVFDPYEFDGVTGAPDPTTVQTGLANPNINLIGEITADTGRGLVPGGTSDDNGTFADGATANDDNHFVAAVNDSNLFSNVAIVPNGSGEAFGFGGILYLARVKEGSVPAGSSYVTFGTTVVTEDVRPGVAPTTSRLADQSLLERVLVQVADSTTEVSGIFLNSASNLGYQETVRLENEFRVNIVLVEDDGSGNFTFTQAEAVFDANSGTWVNPVTGAAYNTVATLGDLSAGTPSVVSAFMLDLGDQLYSDSAGNLYGYDPMALEDAGFSSEDGVNLDLGRRVLASETNPIIDASVTNIASQIETVLASTSQVGAVSPADIKIGNINTTSLGAVNTGEILGSNTGASIELSGANQEWSERVDKVVAGANTSLSQGIVHSIRQPGSVASQFVPMMNSALNTLIVKASVLNDMTGVNAEIGRSGFEAALSDSSFANVAQMNVEALSALTGGISTTGLGAVNTGTIVSGANAKTKAIVASIVGDSGT